MATLKIRDSTGAFVEVPELRGTDGRGIVSITRTLGTGAAGTTDTYTIEYSDATTDTFLVYNGKDGQAGIDGQNGLSAYELAAAGGFSGTVTEWLASIKGSDGSDGQPGQDGKDFTILGYYADLTALQAAIPSPGAGDAYGIGSAAPYDIYVWDGVNLVWKNNGAIQGADGATFTPSVSEAGDLSWANDKGLANPATVNIKGADGSDAAATPLSDDNPVALGTASPGTSPNAARGDHVHPHDSTKLDANKITYGTTDLTAGSSPLPTGALYFVYE